MRIKDINKHSAECGIATELYEYMLKLPSKQEMQLK